MSQPVVPSRFNNKNLGRGQGIPDPGMFHTIYFVALFSYSAMFRFLVDSVIVTIAVQGFDCRRVG